MDDKGAYKGEISEWNEGTLFSIRMHEAKEMINYSKINPLEISPFNQKFNYENWIAGISILYEEGYAKYSPTELEDVNKVKKLIVARIQHMPIHIKKRISSFSGTTQTLVPDYKNWEALRRLIEIYEQKVKYYNDKRGMGTRNRTTEGLFG